MLVKLNIRSDSGLGLKIFDFWYKTVRNIDLQYELVNISMMGRKTEAMIQKEMIKMGENREVYAQGHIHQPIAELI